MPASRSIRYLCMYLRQRSTKHIPFIDSHRTSTYSRCRTLFSELKSIRSSHGNVAIYVQSHVDALLTAFPTVDGRLHLLLLCLEAFNRASAHLCKHITPTPWRLLWTYSVLLPYSKCERSHTEYMRSTGCVRIRNDFAIQLHANAMCVSSSFKDTELPAWPGRTDFPMLVLPSNQEYPLRRRQDASSFHLIYTEYSCTTNHPLSPLIAF